MRPWQALRLSQHAHVETYQDVDRQIRAYLPRVLRVLKQVGDLPSDPVEQRQDHLLVFWVLEMFPGIAQEQTQTLIERKG